MTNILVFPYIFMVSNFNTVNNYFIDFSLFFLYFYIMRSKTWEEKNYNII